MTGSIVKSGCTDLGAADDLPNCVVPVGNSPTRGPADAWVTIVEFGDFECPYCASAEPIIKELDVERPGLRWVYKELPLTSIHPRALPTAIAAECAGAQGYFWEMHDLLFLHQDAQSDTDLANYAQQIGLDLTQWQTCLSAADPIERIAADESDATSARVNSTPSFFINGQSLVGARPLPDFLTRVDRAQQAASLSGSAQSRYYSDRESQGCL
jgi:protein-disulfide isomerase